MLAEVLRKVSDGVHIFWSNDFRRWASRASLLYSEIEDVSHFALFRSSSDNPLCNNLVETIM